MTTDAALADTVRVSAYPLTDASTSYDRLIAEKDFDAHRFAV